MKAFKSLFLILLTTATLYALGSSIEYALSLYKNDELHQNRNAIEELKSQAMQGNTDAAFLLASAYKNGKLGVVDLAKSYYWYKEAALHGDGDAMLMLGWLHYKGTRNTPVNMSKAKYWFTQASQLGVDEAIDMLELLK